MSKWSVECECVCMGPDEQMVSGLRDCDCVAQVLCNTGWKLTYSQLTMRYIWVILWKIGPKRVPLSEWNKYLIKTWNFLNCSQMYFLESIHDWMKTGFMRNKVAIALTYKWFLLCNSSKQRKDNQCFTCYWWCLLSVYHSIMTCSQQKPKNFLFFSSAW